MTIILAFVFLNEPISFWRLVGLIVYTAGTFMMIVKKKSDDKTTSQTWIFYAVLSAVFASLTSILAKLGIAGVESNLGTTIRTVVVLFMSFLMVFVTGKGSQLKTINQKDLRYIIASGFMTGASWLCFYFALQIGEASVVVPIDKLSILVTMFFAAVFLKEKFQRKEIFGLSLIVIGTLLLVLG